MCFGIWGGELFRVKRVLFWGHLEAVGWWGVGRVGRGFEVGS